MTYNRLPGVYFAETTETTNEYVQEYKPLFLVQTATAIDTLDDKITEFESMKAFKTLANGKGLTKTIKYMTDILNEASIDSFYVYSIKTITTDVFTDIIKSTTHLDDVTDIVYVEESKSSTQNPLTAKITAIKNGLDYNMEHGVFRKCYIIPYGTVTDRLMSAEDETVEEAYISAFTEILAGEGNGRICITIPDSNGGNVVGKCIACNYDEEAGYTELENVDVSSIPAFDYNQMLTLQNLGVLFIRPEKQAGITLYKINLGVTTSFKESSSDGLIVCRDIADELLRRVKSSANMYVKAQESTTTLTELKSEISSIISEMSDEGCIVKSKTKLTAVDAGNSTFTITGEIQPVKSVIAIEVNTTLLA